MMKDKKCNGRSNCKKNVNYNPLLLQGVSKV